MTIDIDELYQLLEKKVNQFRFFEHRIETLDTNHPHYEMLLGVHDHSMRQIKGEIGQIIIDNIKELIEHKAHTNQTQ